MYQGRLDQGAASISREYAGLFSFHQGGRIGQFEKNIHIRGEGARF